MIVHSYTTLTVNVLVLCGIALLSAAYTGVAHAGETHISNRISVTSNSGGNRAEGGEIRTGSNSSSVFIETRVNDEVVEKVDETIQSDDGESTYIHVQSSYSSDRGQETVVETSHTSNEEALVEEQATTTATTVDTVIRMDEESAESIEATSTVHVEEQSLFVCESVTRFFKNAVAYVFTLFTTNTSTPRTEDVRDDVDRRAYVLLGSNATISIRSGGRST